MHTHLLIMRTGHLDNKTSIRRVLVVTSMIALPYSFVQGALEVMHPDQDFFVPSKTYELFGHGGSLFWLISSIIFTLVCGRAGTTRGIRAVPDG